MSKFVWLIEAPGQRYLAPRKISLNYDFTWSQDDSKALAFRSEDQADMTMMAIRQALPALFDFERTLGNAKAVEHGYLDIHGAVGDGKVRDEKTPRGPGA